MRILRLVESMIWIRTTGRAVDLGNQQLAPFRIARQLGFPTEVTIITGGGDDVGFRVPVPKQR